MRIIIDLQGAQTESRFRGVGRYTLAMAKAMVRQAGDHQIIVVVNAALPDAIPMLQKQFDGLLAADDFVVFTGLTRTRSQRPENQWRQDAGALLHETFIAGLEPDALFIPAYFEGYVDDATISVSASFPVPTIVTLHDLIPLLNAERYLDHDAVFKAFYQRKIADLKSVTALAAVSQSASDEASSLLGFDPDRIANTSEAADDLFQPLGLTEGASRQLRTQFGIDKPYVLYAGGGDPRKNLERLVEAFGALPDVLRGRHQLVVVGRMGDGERATLQLTARRSGIAEGDVILAGYVADADLVRLYNDCAVFVMPSLHEGFGLPALEAMQSGAPVIGSHASSIPEVIGYPEALFDPLSIPAMRDLLQRVLSDTAFRQSLIEHGLDRAKLFSWDSSAQRTLALIETSVAAKTVTRVWSEWPAYADGMERSLLDAILHRTPKSAQRQADLVDLSQAIADNRRLLDARKRRIDLPERQPWRMEGPFDSSYSLALVNRELARAMIAEGHDVTLHSAEGGGSYAPPPDFLASEPDLAPHFTGTTAATPGIVSRNLYPPRVADSAGRINLLHNYAWEETGFPPVWVDDFNDYLQGLTVTASHVKKLLVDSGVVVPISVVGNGVDHWDRDLAKPYPLSAKSFRFLHVSSAFPRKGPDVLLAAYAAAFTDADDVSLVIKTFDNPHNTIAAQIEALRLIHPNLGEIVLIQQDLSPEQLKGLYEQCQVLVAPSRAEGFGLPIAEAILAGLSVLATAWSGQLDFLADDPHSLVDFEFAAATSHLPVFDSVWAEPSVSDLADKMRWSVDEPQPSRAARVSKLQNRLRADFTWQSVAQRTTRAMTKIAAAPVTKPAAIAWISTFAARCGIATYSQHLIDAIAAPVQIFAAFDVTAIEAEGYNFERCWSQGQTDLSRLTQAILTSNASAVVFQFNYGFFDFAALKALIRAVHDSGRTIVMMLHSTRDPAHAPDKKLAHLVPELRLCDRLLAHSIGDLNRLKALGLIDNVALFPHGVLDSPPSLLKPDRNEPIIASYGFFLPDKGLLELIQAFALLRADGFKGRLRMVNAEFPAPVSASLIMEARRLIRDYELRNVVDLHTDFLSDARSLELLAPARMVVYPYQQTAESASGAVRYGLASRLPVVTSPLPIFEDIAGAVYQLPGMSPAHIADGIKSVLRQLDQQDPIVTQTTERAAAWRDSHVYSRLGRRLSHMVTALVRDKRTKF